MSKSSDEQASLDQFKTAREIVEEEDVDLEKPSWEPMADNEPDTEMRVKCELCPNTVHKQFARVFGDNDDNLVNGCPECSSLREIRNDPRVGTGIGKAGDSQ